MPTRGEKKIRLLNTKTHVSFVYGRRTSVSPVKTAPLLVSPSWEEEVA